MESDHARRDDLKAKVIAGAMKPSEAEAEAARLGLEAFEYRPDPRDYDPMREQFWTLPMVVAWIAYRTADAVRENWDEYRAECRHWRHVGQSGALGEVGHDLFHFDLTNLTCMQVYEELQQPADRNDQMSVAQAQQELWQALRNSAIEASGVELTTQKREVIDALRLQDLTLGVMNNRDVLLIRRPIGIGPVRYVIITIPRVAVCDHWQADMLRSSASDLTQSRSGAPGRPTSMHLIEAEFRHRCEEGLVKEHISDEATFLSSWLKASHPQEHPTTAKTIRNKLGSPLRAYWMARK
jgi:hypothetical protein